MAVKENRVAYGVRVKLNENFQVKCLGDEYLKEEPVLFISASHCYNDERGKYVMIKGGSLTTSGYVYLDEIDLIFEVPEKPLYVLYDFKSNDVKAGEKCPPTKYNELEEKLKENKE
jgi:hypothetical protein